MAIDFSTLPAPKVIEELDFETLLAANKAQLMNLTPPDKRAALAEVINLESEPLNIQLQLASYRELLLRQRVNEAARATLLAYAEDEDLDNKAADYGVTRLVVTPADPTATPPVEAVMESNARLRFRCQLAMEGLSVAGPRGAYAFHAYSASADVLHVDVVRGAEDGDVDVWLLSAKGDGIGDANLLATVQAALSAEDVVPLCDNPIVKAAKPVAFEIVAAIDWLPGGKEATGGTEAAAKRVADMLAERRQIRATVSRSAIDAAIHKAGGVNKVSIISPVADIECLTGTFPACTRIDLR